jgi:hypothetical protein
MLLPISVHVVTDAARILRFLKNQPHLGVTNRHVSAQLESWRTPSHFVGLHAKLTGHDAELSNSNDCCQCQKLDRHHQEVSTAAAGPTLALSRCHLRPQEQVQWLRPVFFHAKLSVRNEFDACNHSGTARGGPFVLDCPAVSQCAAVWVLPPRLPEQCVASAIAAPEH